MPDKSIYAICREVFIILGEVGRGVLVYNRMPGWINSRFVVAKKRQIGCVKVYL
jgi:hypothetical protein